MFVALAALLAPLGAHKVHIASPVYQAAASAIQPAGATSEVQPAGVICFSGEAQLLAVLFWFGRSPLLVTEFHLSQGVSKCEEGGPLCMN